MVTRTSGHHRALQSCLGGHGILDRVGDNRCSGARFRHRRSREAPAGGRGAWATIDEHARAHSQPIAGRDGVSNPARPARVTPSIRLRRQGKTRSAPVRRLRRPRGTTPSLGRTRYQWRARPLRRLLFRAACRWARAGGAQSGGDQMKDYRHGWGTLVVSLLGLLLFAGRADAVPADSLSYALITPPSSLEVGCFGPCDCAVQETPTYGSFDLIRTGADAVYTYYEIHRYIASFNNGPGAVSMIGAGTYKLDRSAGLQEMTLDLEVWGQPQHFDSGIVPVGAAFPEILAACAANAFACMD